MTKFTVRCNTTLDFSDMQYKSKETKVIITLLSNLRVAGRRIQTYKNNKTEQITHFVNPLLTTFLELNVETALQEQS
jgi:protein tyrosine phosphatase